MERWRPVETMGGGRLWSWARLTSVGGGSAPCSERRLAGWLCCCGTAATGTPMASLPLFLGYGAAVTRNPSHLRRRTGKRIHHIPLKKHQTGGNSLSPPLPNNAGAESRTPGAAWGKSISFPFPWLLRQSRIKIHPRNSSRFDLHEETNPRPT